MWAGFLCNCSINVSSRHKTFVTHKAVSIHVIYSIHIYILHSYNATRSQKNSNNLCSEYGRGCSRNLQIVIWPLICGLNPQLGPASQSAQLSFNLPWGGEIPPGQCFFLSPSVSLLLKSSFLLSFCSVIYPHLCFIVILSPVEPTYMLLHTSGYSPLSFHHESVGEWLPLLDFMDLLWIKPH